MAAPMSALTMRAFSSLSDEEFALVVDDSPENGFTMRLWDFLREMHRRQNYDRRGERRKKALSRIRPRNNTTIALVDHAMLLEDEILEMNKSVLHLQTYVAAYIGHEEELCVMSFDRDYSEDRSLLIDTSKPFDKDEAAMLCRVMGEEAPTLLSDLRDEYEKLRVVLMDAGELSVGGICDDVRNNGAFVVYAIYNMIACRKLAQVLNVEKGKKPEAETESLETLFRDLVDNTIKLQGLKDIREICGYPKHSKDSRWLNKKGRAELEDERVQERLRKTFDMDMLVKLGLWFGEGYKEGDYVDEDSYDEDSDNAEVGAGLARHILQNLIRFTTGEGEPQVPDNPDDPLALKTFRFGKTVVRASPMLDVREWSRRLNLSDGEDGWASADESHPGSGSAMRDENKKPKEKWYRKLKSKLRKK